MSTAPDMLTGFDPFAAEVIADPAAWYARMRAEQPVFRVPGHGFYLVTRHDDVVAAISAVSPATMQAPIPPVPRTMWPHSWVPSS